MIDYEAYYQPQPGDERWAGWRELGARVKVDHIVELLRRGGLQMPASVLEVGCGDGSVLEELGRRGIGERRVGLEVSRRATAIARQKPSITEVRAYDGETIPFLPDDFELGVATHVLEHVAEPRRLLEELARVARAVIVEVPLERNLAARRPAARALSSAAGHTQSFTAGDIRTLLEHAGLVVLAELSDPLPRHVHTFRGGALVGSAKWALRRALASWPALGQRVMTMHYAALARSAVPAQPHRYTS